MMSIANIPVRQVAREQAGFVKSAQDEQRRELLRQVFRGVLLAEAVVFRDA